MLPVRTTSRLLLTFAAVAVAGGIALLVLAGFVVPLAEPNAVENGGAPRVAWDASPGVGASAPAVQPAELERLVATPLRRSLAGVSSTAAAVPSAPPPAEFPPMVLVGTIGNSMAMLRTPGGAVQLKSAGERIGGATVRSVSRERVEFDWNGRVIAIARSAAPAATRPAPAAPETTPAPAAPPAVTQD